MFKTFEDSRDFKIRSGGSKDFAFFEVLKSEEIIQEHPKKGAPKLSDNEIRKLARKAVGLVSVEK